MPLSFIYLLADELLISERWFFEVLPAFLRMLLAPPLLLGLDKAP